MRQLRIKIGTIGITVGGAVSIMDTIEIIIGCDVYLIDTINTTIGCNVFLHAMNYVIAIDGIEIAVRWHAITDTIKITIGL